MSPPCGSPYGSPTLRGRSGAQLASGGADKVIRLWDTHDGRMTGKLEGMVETVTDLAFLADSQSLMAAGSDFALRMFNLETSRVRHTFTGHTRTVGLGGPACEHELALPCRLIGVPG